jgi:hypothetical protein
MIPATFILNFILIILHLHSFQLGIDILKLLHSHPPFSKMQTLFVYGIISFFYFIHIAGRIILDVTQLHKHKSLHKQIFDQFAENNISLPTTTPAKISTTQGSYESGLVSCFGTKEKEMDPPAILKANSQLPSLCNISFTDMSMETKIYCYALIFLWSMLVFSALIYQIKTFKMFKNGKPKRGEMLTEMEEVRKHLKDLKIVKT